MTDDDSTIPKTAPRPTQRLDVPEALLTAEWNVADLAWLEPDATSESSSPKDAESSAPPPPPSRRRAQVAAAARPGEAGPQQPAVLPSRQQGVTVPRPQRPVHAAPTILINDPGATLPPRDQRVAEQGPLPGTPSIAPPLRLGRGRPSFVALGAALGCAVGYALWTGVLHPTVAGAAADGGLPQFLRETPANVAAPAVVPVSSPAPPPSTLPPSLAATLSEALPAATSEAESSVGDAGAPPVAPALIEDRVLPSSIPVVSADTQRRATALRAVLEAQRADPTDRKSETPSALVSKHASAPPPELVTKWSNDAASLRSRRPRHEPPPPAAPLPPPPPSAAIRPLTTYTYEDKALFPVATAPMRVTDLALEAGETLVSQPTAGDAARWVITVVQGQGQSHVFVKPLRSGLRTNLTLTTNRRSYFLELSCRDDGTYMAGVAWRYPADDSARRRDALARAERERQSTTAVSDLQALRFDYHIVAGGDAPSWKPIMVFDDGAKTFIRFPRPIAASHAPVLFIPRTGTTRDAKYVNYRVKGDLYVLDRLIDAAELRLPSDNDGQDIVRITRKH